MRSTRCLSLPLVALLGASCGFAGVSTQLELEAVPLTILERAKAAAPTAVFSRADVERETDGTAVYEIIGVEPVYRFQTVPTNPNEIDISAFEDDGFGLQLIEVALRDVEVEVDLFENGEIEEIERVIPEKLVPKMVLNRLRQRYPEFEVERVEASYSRHGKIFQYEFSGRRSGVLLDLEVSADGSRIVEADD